MAMTTARMTSTGDRELADLIAAHGEQVTFPRRHVIFAQGNPSGTLHVIRSGRVKTIMHAEEHSREIVLAIHGPADIIDEMTVFDPGPRASTAIALTDVEAVVIRHSTLRTLLFNRPHLTEHMLRSLAKQTRRSVAQRADMVLTDVPSRTAKVLLQLATRFGRTEGRALRVDHGLTQKELAQYVGASREVMNRVLAGFSRRGWLQADGTEILIVEPSGLAGRIQ